MKDTVPGPDGIPYSVYNKLWEFIFSEPTNGLPTPINNGFTHP